MPSQEWDASSRDRELIRLQPSHSETKVPMYVDGAVIMSDWKLIVKLGKSGGTVQTRIARLRRCH